MPPQNGSTSRRCRCDCQSRRRCGTCQRLPPAHLSGGLSGVSGAAVAVVGMSTPVYNPLLINKERTMLAARPFRFIVIALLLAAPALVAQVPSATDPAKYVLPPK